MTPDELKARRVPADWMTDRQRRRVQRDAPALPKPEPLPAPVVIHFGYLTGFKSRQEFTSCGRKAKGVACFDQWEYVTCPACLRDKPKPLNPDLPEIDAFNAVRR